MFRSKISAAVKSSDSIYQAGPQLSGSAEHLHLLLPRCLFAAGETADTCGLPQTWPHQSATGQLPVSRGHVLPTSSRDKTSPRDKMSQGTKRPKGTMRPMELAISAPAPQLRSRNYLFKKILVILLYILSSVWRMQGWIKTNFYSPLSNIFLWYGYLLLCSPVFMLLNQKFFHFLNCRPGAGAGAKIMEKEKVEPN